MNHDRHAFAARLNEICDDMAVPNRGRPAALSRRFKVSQPAAGKWLDADGYPTLDKAREIASWAGVAFEWLMTGDGPKHPIRHSAESMQLAEIVDQLGTRDRQLVLRLAKAVADINHGITGSH